MRTPDAATMNKKIANTTSAIRPAVIRPPLLAHERRCAPDLEHVHTGARLDHFVVVVRARRPDLAVELHTADTLGVGDALDDGRGLPYQRRGPHLDAPPTLVGA